jgi:putative RNA 2'-phosphotransferase
MTRNFVQLSQNIDIAKEVGVRHGSPVILEINTKQMGIDGIKFYLSNNNVWLTDYISPEYINNEIY